MISICIPTYKTSVNGLVKELLEQSYKFKFSNEILIFDDASTVETNSICSDEFKRHPNIHFFSVENNIGRTRARNFLAQKATNEWLLFLDADTIPKNANFLKRYKSAMVSHLDIICGGIAYRGERPSEKIILRWKYGREREEINSIKRQKNPYYLVSANLLIRKAVFTDLNDIKCNEYGLDNVFSYKASIKKYNIKHIDNNVFHLGLEANEIFLQKSLKAINTLVRFEIKGDLPIDFTKLQKIGAKLKQCKLDGVFIIIADWFSKTLKKNILSSNPSLRFFDIYRLHYYLKKKKELENA